MDIRRFIYNVYDLDLKKKVIWIFKSIMSQFLKVIWAIGRTDAEAEAEAPILWPPNAKSLTGKDPVAGKNWEQEAKGAA